MDKIFRTLVVVSTLLYIAYYFIPYLDHLWLPEDEYRFLTYNGAKSIIEFPNIVFHIIFIAWLITSVGLFLYFNIARKTFVALIIFSILQTPLIGYAAYSPVESLLIYVSNTIDGALLAIMFFTSVNLKFEEAPNN